MRLQTWRGSGEVNGGQQRSTEVNTNQQQESTQVNRSQQKSTEVNEIASPNLEGVNTSQRRSTEVNKNAAPNLEGVNKGQQRSTEVNRSQQQKSTEVNRGQQKSTVIKKCVSKPRGGQFPQFPNLRTSGFPDSRNRTLRQTSDCTKPVKITEYFEMTRRLRFDETHRNIRKRSSFIW